MPEELSVVGKRLPRVDAIEKVKGEAKNVADIQLPRMLQAGFLRSPHAHARIVSIDTTKAEALPGVKGVLTHKNVPKVHPLRKFEYLLDETVHCAGEEVAVVAAETKEIAEEALKLIEVEYEVLPAVFEAEEAMKPGAPLVHPEHGSNMFHGTNAQPVPRCTPEGWLPVEYGDVEKGFTEADYILEGKYEAAKQYHCSPIPRSVICQWTGDQLTCWCDTQRPLISQQDIATSLGIPLSNIRLICSYTVGGYGAKEPQKIATLAALLAKKTGRPVRAVYTREEDFIATHHRMEFKVYEKIGIKKDGTITAIYHRMITNFGRDNVYAFMVPALAAAGACSTLYQWQNSKWEGCTVMTNIVESGAMNGFGSPEALFCLERLIDEAAEKIGMDPVEFRLKNCVRYGDRAQKLENVMGLIREYQQAPAGPLEWQTTGSDIDSLQECIRKVAEKAQWKEKWKGWKTPMEVKGAKRRGIGIAIGLHGTVYELSSATVKMNQDGTANVISGAAEIGQGLQTTMTQVVADALGLHYTDVNVLLADTAAAPASFGSVGDAGTSSSITAAKHAADDAKQKLFNIAAKVLGTKPDDLEAKNRRIYVKEHPEKGMSIAEACFIGYQVIGTAVNPPPDSIKDIKTGKTICPYSVAATIAEVEVDTETGELNVLRVTSAHDCGRALNPTLVENQIDMSIALGNGWVRTENFTIDKSTGVMINPNLLDYKIMTILDMPKKEDMQEIVVEFPTSWGPFGAKGMSEIATTTQAPALANAIYNAIGVRIKGDHLTPERILEALGKKVGR
jgi:CO/xanthine dehydrogenase Mo-binding subunit